MNLEHIAKAFEFSLDGFPFQVVAPIRWIASLLLKKKMLAGEPYPAGIKPPPRFLTKGDLFARLPSEKTTFEEGMEHLRAVLKRVEDGARFTMPDPTFGKLTHDEALTLQLSHAALHMGFINPAELLIPDQSSR